MAVTWWLVILDLDSLQLGLHKEDLFPFLHFAKVVAIGDGHRSSCVWCVST